MRTQSGHAPKIPCSIMEDSVIRRSFRQNLQQFILTDVRPLGNVLGTGSYGSVEEVSFWSHKHTINTYVNNVNLLYCDFNQWTLDCF